MPLLLSLSLLLLLLLLLLGAKTAHGTGQCQDRPAAGLGAITGPFN